MRKYCLILLSVLLSMTILFIGSSLTFMQCAHTGKVKIMTVLQDRSMDGMSSKDCGMNTKCMTVTHVEMSPTITVQTTSFDFHALQPIMAVLPGLVAEWFIPKDKAVGRFFPKVWKSPPRDYLNFIRVLLI